MTDDLNNLKLLMEDATPKPDAARRTANMALAQDNFAALQQRHAAQDPASAKGIWNTVSVWLRSAGAKGAITASVAVIAGGLLLAPQPTLEKVTAPAAPDVMSTQMAEVGAESLAADFAAAAPMAVVEENMQSRQAVVARATDDAAAASNDTLRNTLAQGALPPDGTVQIEDMLSVFNFDFPSTDGMTIMVAQTPWDPQTRAVFIALQAPADALAPLHGAKGIEMQVNFDPAQIRTRRILGQDHDQQGNARLVTIDALRADKAAVYVYEVMPTSVTDSLGEIVLSFGTGDTGERRSIKRQIPAQTELNTDAGFAMALVGFGLLLRDPNALGEWGYDDVIRLADVNRGDDLTGQRTAAIMLMQQARDLSQ
jgi:hypothetical protein